MGKADGYDTLRNIVSKENHFFLLLHLFSMNTDPTVRHLQEIDELIQELAELSVRQQEIVRRFKDLRDPSSAPVASVPVARAQPSGYETGDSEDGEEASEEHTGTFKTSRESVSSASIVSSTVEVVGIFSPRPNNQVIYTPAERAALQSGCSLWTSNVTGKRYIIHPRRRKFCVGDIVKVLNPASRFSTRAPTIRDGTGVVAKVCEKQVVIHTDSGHDLRRGQGNVRYLSAQRDEQYARVQPVKPGRRPNYARYHAA